MKKSFVEIVVEENKKGNGVVFSGIVSTVGINAQVVLNTLILKSVELKTDTFWYPKDELIKNSVTMTKSKTETALKKLEKAGFISIEKECVNGLPPRNYYTVHKDVIEKAISDDEEK